MIAQKKKMIPVLWLGRGWHAQMTSTGSTGARPRLSSRVTRCQRCGFRSRRLLRERVDLKPLPGTGRRRWSRFPIRCVGGSGWPCRLGWCWVQGRGGGCVVLGGITIFGFFHPIVAGDVFNRRSCENFGLAHFSIFLLLIEKKRLIKQS